MENDNSDLLASASEIQRDRLYFVAFKKCYKPKNTPNTVYFCIDDDFVYENFYNDFGPLNICMLYRYCQKLNAYLHNKLHANKKIVHYTSMLPAKRLNAACLIGSYAVIYLNKTPEEAYRPLVAGDTPAYTRFCDASYGASGYKISLIDCINAIHKALKAGFVNFNDFDAEEYEFYERVENGDLNWIVPQKFMAFCGPHQKSKVLANGYPCHSPETYFSYFRENNVTLVIRLNAKVYHASSFENAGFQHKDLFFIDGSTPSDLILKKFLSLCETTKGAIAVHCKAGLGRTGSLIGAYIMKHYNFSALEAIAWLRLCRPGSVIGHQQQWMEDKQSWLWSEGERARKRYHNAIPKHKFGIYSLQLKSKNVETNENSEMLLSRVTGISQKVDTMHLYDGGGGVGGYEKNANGIAHCTRAAAAAAAAAIMSKRDKLDGGTVNSASNTETEDEDAYSNQQRGAAVRNTLARRRKSPSSASPRRASTPPPLTAAATTSSAAATTAKMSAPLTAERTLTPSSFESRPPIAVQTSPPVYTDKRLRKPTILVNNNNNSNNNGILESAQKHTIASTVKMHQAAIDKKCASQTQGDKLNQIKAMRRQHMSRASNIAQANNNDNTIHEPNNLCRQTRARSQPFRNNNNIVNMPSPATTSAMSALKTSPNSMSCLVTRMAGNYEYGGNFINSNLNHNNNNNNIYTNNNNNSSMNNTNNNNNNINNAVTTRTKSLGMYSKRMGLMHLRKAEQQQQQQETNTINNNNNTAVNIIQPMEAITNNINSSGTTTSVTNASTATLTATATLTTTTTNDDGIAVSHNTQAHNIPQNETPAPALSAPSTLSTKQTKTYNNTLLSSSTRESKIPIVRSGNATVAAAALSPLPDYSSAVSGGGSRGSGCAAATIPGPRSGASTRLMMAPPPPHHHMTLRSRSRLRYHRSAPSVEQPCSTVTARYYRDVSAIPTKSAGDSPPPDGGGGGGGVGSVSSGGVGGAPSAAADAGEIDDVAASSDTLPTTATTTLLDLNSNPLDNLILSSDSSRSSTSCSILLKSLSSTKTRARKQQQQQQQQQQPSQAMVQRLSHALNHSNCSNKRSTNNNNNINKCSSSNGNNNNNEERDLVDHDLMADIIIINNDNKGTHQQHQPLRSTISCIPITSGNNNNNNINNTVTTTTTTTTTKRNKRSLSSTRIEKDKCDEYNTKLLRKTAATIGGNNNNNNNNISSNNNSNNAVPPASATTSSNNKRASAALVCRSMSTELDATTTTTTTATTTTAATLTRNTISTISTNNESNIAAIAVAANALSSTRMEVATTRTTLSTTAPTTAPTTDSLYLPGGGKYAGAGAAVADAAVATTAALAARHDQHLPQQQQREQQLSLKLRKKISY